MKVIKFKRAFFFDEAKTKFSHFDSWGVNVDGANWQSSNPDNTYIGARIDAQGVRFWVGYWRLVVLFRGL